MLGLTVCCMFWACPERKEGVPEQEGAGGSVLTRHIVSYWILSLQVTWGHRVHHLVSIEKTLPN